MKRCLVSLLLLSAAMATTMMAAPWPVSTGNGTHLFLTFDRYLTAADIETSLPPSYGFVWGASSSKIAAYKRRTQATGQRVVTTQYWPFCRLTSEPLAWWQLHHPTWVLYKCDRVTPAYEFGDPNMPVDISNPEVLEYQITSVVEKLAVAGGYDGMAMDNFGLSNGFRACGVYRRASATNETLVWHQLYSGESADPVYREMVVTWVEAFAARVHALGLLVTLNWSIGGDAVDDPAVLRVANATDAAVAEAGFTDYGSRMLVGADWVKRIDFMQMLQSRGKAYFSINEWANASTMSRLDQEWLLASYIVGKSRAAGIFASTVQGYGGLVDVPLLNGSVAFDAGVPLRGDAPPYVDAATGVYYRNTTTCVAVVNPWPAAQAVWLDPSKTYRSVWGTLVINGETAMVLVVAS